MIAAPAGHVSLMIKSKTSDERICGGRMPDAIMDSSGGVSLPIKGVGVGTTNTDLALGGRNPQVLIVRELLYRLCEISLNSELAPKEVVELYKDTLPLVSMALKTSMTGTAALSVVGENPNLNPASSLVPQPQNPYSGALQPGGLDPGANSFGGLSQPGGVPPATSLPPSNGVSQSGGYIPSGGTNPSGGFQPAGAIPQSDSYIPPAGTNPTGGAGTPAGGVAPVAPNPGAGPAQPDPNFIQPQK